MREVRVVERIRPVALPALVGAGVGALGLLAGLLVDPRRTAFAYLAAFLLALSLALGALCTVLIGHAISSRWFVVVRRAAETVAVTLPLFVLLFLPLLAGLDELYPWVAPIGDPALAEHVERIDGWLNVPFFVGRSLVYLLVWGGMALLLWRWSTEPEGADTHRESVDRRRGGDDRHRGGDVAPAAPPPPDRRPLLLAAVGLPVFGFTVTFAAMDWIMSLTPEWYSTVFGAYYWAGGFLASYALLVVLAYGLERGGLLREELAESHYHALGRLLLTFAVFWAYLAFSQGFLIWIADLPHEVPWYLARWEGPWKWATITLLVAHFAVPFTLLLSRRVKRTPSLLAAVAGWILLAHVVDVYWLVLPSVGLSGDGPHWLDLAALLAVVGSAVAFAAWRLRGAAVAPAHDPRLESGRRYASR